MSDAETANRSFSIVQQKDLLGDVVAEIMFGIYPTEDDADVPLAEMAFRWHDHGNATPCRLEVFDESWAALSRMPDLLAAIGTMMAEPDASKPWRTPARPTVETVAAMLSGLGFRDRTEEWAA